MLPLHGRYAGPSQAIRNGFLAAHDADKKQRHVESQVNIIDTSGKNVVELYQRAVDQGANVIVGPLTKEEVQRVANLPEHSVPTLALNMPDTALPKSMRFYQFGLSPIDEYQAIAQKAYASGYRKAIILTPNTAWGKTAAITLNKQWQALGGRVVEQLAYATSMQQLSHEIPHLLKVTQGEKPNQPSTHRQDFEVILLAAPSPTNAKEILSLLKYHYAHHIPVYATSSAYSGIPNPAQDQELNGLYFCDIPWISTAQLSEPLASIKQHTKTLWSNHYHQFPRFYALGVDAYRLVSNATGAQYGATGYLTVDRENKIHRQLRWFQIRNGLPVNISQ